MPSVADEPQPSKAPRRSRRWWLALLAIPAALAGASWYFTASLDDHPVPPPAESPTAQAPPPEAPDRPVAWPDRTLDGEPAKALLLDVTRRALARVEHAGTYTATFRRQERINGVLGPEIVSDLKIRNRPFAIYLKYRTVKPGKEVVYAEGHHDNKVIAHNGDWTRKLIPRIAVEPTAPLALADSRHPITDAGLLNLCRKLLRFREMDLGEAEAATVLDRVTLDDGRTFLRSTHEHSKRNDGRPFQHVVILYDPTTQVPCQIQSFDWAAPGDSGPLKLAERYAYDDLHLGAPLTPMDFDPRNPDYAFLRF